MERLDADFQRRAIRRPLQQAGSDQPTTTRADQLSNPILELQREAGNAAVTRLLAVQRHSLSPEEEAGS